MGSSIEQLPEIIFSQTVKNISKTATKTNFEKFNRVSINEKIYSNFNSPRKSKLLVNKSNSISDFKKLAVTASDSNLSSNNT